MTEITVTVNGRVVVEEVEPRLLLTDFLRHRLGLTGTHVGCEHGVCGACTVRLDGVSVRACCLLAVQVDGSVVDTVESLAGDAMLSPLQDAFKRHHALQCGFCTPGHPDRRRRPPLPRRPVPRRRSSTCSPGHLCRCTGYAPIVAAIEDARDSPSQGPEGGAVNLAQSLLDACERHPGARGVPRDPLRRAAAARRPDRRRARRRARRAGRGRARQPARDGAPLLGLPVGGRRLRASLVAPLGGGARLLHRRRRRSGRDPRGRRRSPTGPSTTARSTATSARSRSCSTPPARRAARRASRAPMRPTAPAASARRCSTATDTATGRSA